jgi:cytochrome c oxidase subunit IV
MTNSIRLYVFVFLALLGLTATTVAVSRVDLGAFNFVAAMTIAVLKASLVVWFFMHVRQSSPLIKLAAFAGLFWIAILIVFTLGDYWSRAWLPSPTWWR